MSNKFSSTPSPNLTVRPSRYRRYFLLFLALVASVTTIQVFLKGYPVLAALVGLTAAAWLWRAGPDPMVGAGLKWQGGEWFLRCGGKQVSVWLLPAAVRTPWVIYLPLRETHASTRWNLWLFPDSAAPEQLRRLRCRLVLAESRPGPQ